MYCRSCGKSIDDDSTFCTFCGVNLHQQAYQAEREAALQWKQAHDNYKSQMKNRIAQRTAESERASGRSARPRPNLDILKEDSMYCIHCGAKIDIDSSFCCACGRSIMEQRHPIPTSQNTTVPASGRHNSFSLWKKRK